MITDLFEQGIAKILTFYSVSPGSKFTRKEIQEKVLMNNIPLDKSLNILIADNILCKEKRLLSLNFENDYVKLILNIIKKEHQRFKEIPLKVYYALIDVSLRLSVIKSVSGAYLFGSYAKLIHAKDSDIDLAIISNKRSIKKEISKIEKRYGVLIEDHYFTEKDMESNDSLIKEIKRNSVSLK